MQGRDFREESNFADITKLLLATYIKVLKVNLSNDTYKELKLNEDETNEESGYSDKLSTWLHDFALAGNVYQEDVQNYLSFCDYDSINQKLDAGEDKISLRYRRKVNNEYRWVRMTLEKSDEYSDDHRILVLYVDDINEDVINTKKIVETQNDLNESHRITDSLMYIYFTCLYVDMNDNTYKTIYVDPSLQANIQDEGNMFDVVEMYEKSIMVPTDMNAFNQQFSVSNIKDVLQQQASYDYDYWCKHEGKDVCCRISAILVDKNEDGSVHHIIMTMQDITTSAKFKAETNSMIKDAFNQTTAANNAKSDFLSRMSHDMRTPLNGIIGMTAIAGAHIDEKAKVEDCLTKITGASKHLLSLINDILDLSKIESGKLALIEENFNLSELLSDTVDMFSTDVINKNLTLNIYTENIKHENIVGDAKHLKEVFSNLVSNAIKYTPSGGKVNLTLRELPLKSNSIGLYEFVCEDNGYGMSDEFQKKMFEPFERAEDERVSDTQGTGLGMSIVKNIVSLMGGDIDVESQLNVGTKFTITFKMKLQENTGVSYEDLYDLSVLVVDDDPITCESACITLNDMGMKPDFTLTGEEAITKITDAHSTNNDYFACLIDWKMPTMDGFETTRKIRKIVGPDVTIIIISAYEWEDIEKEALEAGANGFIAKPLFKSRLQQTFRQAKSGLVKKINNELLGFKKNDYSNKKILLVEDNELNREIATEIISQTKCEIVTAENGLKALNAFKESKENEFDMILMDISMPVMNGYEATKAIRELDREDGKEIPIIALTANAFIDDIHNALEAGMNAHLSKPIDFNQLLEVMQQYLK